MTYDEIVTEIGSIQNDLYKYNSGITMSESFSYKDTLKRLTYLRNRKRQLTKSKRDTSENEQ